MSFLLYEIVNEIPEPIAANVFGLGEGGDFYNKC